jgi:hypothetical protein
MRLSDCFYRADEMGGTEEHPPASKSSSLLLCGPLGRATIVCRNAYTAGKNLMSGVLNLGAREELPRTACQK